MVAMKNLVSIFDGYESPTTDAVDTHHAGDVR